MIHIRRLPLLLLVCAALSGCSVVGERVRNAVEEGTTVPAGSVVAGDGFSVRSPESGLLVVRNEPRRGFLSLRNTSREMFLGGGSYNVYPFVLDPPPSSLRDAWYAHTYSQFSAEGRATYHILTERTGTWRGQPAYFQTAYAQQSPYGGGVIAVTCVIQRGNRYYWVVRSVSVLNNQPETISRARARGEKELPPFLNGLAFSNAPAA